MYKSDSAEVVERVEKVFQLIIQGNTSNAIVKYCMDTWGVHDTMSRNYIKRAKSMIKQMAEKKQKSALSDMLARHDDIRSRAYKTGDFRLVLEVDREDSKLLGIYAPDKVDNRTDMNIVVRWGDSDDNNA